MLVSDTQVSHSDTAWKAPSMDAQYETFAPMQEFCWNCVEIPSGVDHPEYKHCKCLGHSVGETNGQERRAIQYADSSLGLVRQRSEAIFLALKLKIQEMPTPMSTAHGVALSFGHIWGCHYECAPQHQVLLEWALAFFTFHSKQPMTGLSIYCNITSFTVATDCWVVLWDHKTFSSVVVKPVGPCFTAGTSAFEEHRHLMSLLAGEYSMTTTCCGIVYTCSIETVIGDCRVALEVDGFPIPSGQRVTAFDKSLTSCGLERGRLPQMYRVGDDTAAVYLLLLHAASTLSLDGVGISALPHYIGDEFKASLISDLEGMARRASGRVVMTHDDVRHFRDRVKIPLLGILLCGSAEGEKPPIRFVTPAFRMSIDWTSVAFRLTFGWISPEAAAATDSATLAFEKYEIGGAALTSGAHALLPTDIEFQCTATLFFEEAASLSVRDSRPDLDFVSVSGNDVHAAHVANDAYFRPSRLAELSRRSGIPVPKFNEALGEIKAYRLHGGLLQKLVYSKTVGNPEYLTVIHMGNWRSVEYAGETRRVTLRRHIINIFHFTPMGPHRSRDRTMQAIIDAGCWWPKIYQECQMVVRLCHICAYCKNTPLVSGQQRSREYDGPFRFLIIDYIGPMNPESYRGHKYMFTCACAWSGWYWAIPCMLNDSETAATCLFYYVICDLAGYPTCIGSDRDKAFVEGIIKSLMRLFNVTHVIGTAYHPQAQSAVERPHREYNMMCKTFMLENRNWDRLSHIFVWTIRTTSKLFNGSYTPYETITGLQPRSPIDGIVQPTTLQRAEPTTYVTELVQYLKQVHQFVEQEHSRIRADASRAKLRSLGSGVGFSLGDYVLVQKQAEPGVSKRFQAPNYDQVYQVVEIHGADGSDARAYTLSDLQGSRSLGFSQPVAADRLTAVEVLPLAQAERTSTRGSRLTSMELTILVPFVVSQQTAKFTSVSMTATKFRSTTCLRVSTVGWPSCWLSFSTSILAVCVFAFLEECLLRGITETS